MTNAMLQDLARMMANKAMAQLLNFAVGAMVSWASGGGDGTDAADGFDGGGGGTLKANGGPVLAGSPYIVGEKRPELFVPSSNGTIIPDLGGGSPQISIQIIVNNDGTATTTTDGGSDNEKSKMMAEAVAFKIRRTIQEELAPGGDIHTFVTRG
jgi:phage-related minor tail protein